ncbi:XRE family transcriptional regulator [Actinoplanes ianthinogenes]|uniref:XRE family transcriptional regulator n=1 Tax=Actinoplanes ianthinogenes TaxID=122358 RepID=A0ABN6CQ04_9ACTN|nr:helix-turn-helix transcriptional regulator [Actinoplanes ianthinogenes]BCJ47296.1 XRE family transcriptional regulator [Actinoplanes ianthinogenes]GGR42173.1 XRE family transcriptional regulator [Actinoplanes ianthinogenes]
MTSPGTGSTIGAELRRWRDVRRISQLELATRAGTTQRHLSFVEGGRSSPGRHLVLRLAESLDLSLRDRNTLLAAAGYAAAYTETSLDDPRLQPVRQALRQVVAGHMPYPALIAGPHGEIVDANAAIDLLTEGASPELCRPPLNIWRLALHPEGMAARVENLAVWGRHVVAGLRARAARHPDARLDELVTELVGYLPALPATDRDYLGFAVPLRLRTADGTLRLITTLTSLATAVDVTLAELHLEAWLPADGETADLLRRRARTRGRGSAGS